MVLLDVVVEIAGDRCVAGWTVPADSPWIENGRLLRAAFVEIAAQTAALGAATSDAAPRHGYLGAASEFRVHGDARPGDALRSTARRVAQFGALSRVDCRVERIDGESATLLAEGGLTVAVAGG